MSIRLKRAYDEPESTDGYRVLIDRLWPRGISREDLRLDLWLKEIAPSDELRKWFNHDPQKWDEFKERYFAELENHADVVKELAQKTKEGQVTLVYAAKEREHNNAVALKEYLEKQK